MTPTSVSITVKVLMEMRKLNTREGGTTILAAAVVDDVLGILVLTVAISMIRGGGSVNYSSLAEVLISVSLLLFFFLYFGPEMADRVFRYVSKIDLPESETAFALVFLIVFAYLAEHLSLASILGGAYLTGLALGQIPKKKAIMEHMNVLGYSLFIPLFFVEVGMRIELSYILHAGGLFAVLYTTAAIVSKVIGCGLGGARLGGFEWESSLRIGGVGMIPGWVWSWRCWRLRCRAE